jgi:FHS family glucose/mannose:H+ symporter-like MFS transporter
MTSFLGATLPELSTRLNFDLGRGGALFSFLYFPQIPMVFLVGPLIDRFGKKPVLAGGFLLCAAALVGIAYVPSYAVLGALLVALGLGASSAATASNTLIPDLYPENPSSALNLGNIFFGVGAIFFPWLITLLAVRLGLVSTLWLITLLVAGVAVVAFMQRFPPASAGGRFNWQEARRLALNPAVIILALVLFFYSAVEISTAGWTRTFLQQDLLATPHASKIILMIFWIALMVGRLAASQVVKFVRGPHLVLAASVGAVCGLLVVTTAHSVAVATLGIVICGLSYAPVFPTTAGTASTYFPRLFATVFGILMAVGLTAGVILPPAIGYVAKIATVRAGIWLVAAFAVLLTAVQAIFLVYERRRLLKSAS